MLCESSDALQVHVVPVGKSPSRAAFEKEAACGVDTILLDLMLLELKVSVARHGRCLALE